MLLLSVVAVARITATYPVFSQTWDEAYHIACGMQWLQAQEYTYEPQHPPLARIAVALPLYLSGVRAQFNPDAWTTGNNLVEFDGRYLHNLTLARVGVLPFFLPVLGVTWIWARRLSGKTAGVIALLLVSTLPALLAHAGLATTDIPATAMMFASVFTFSRWLELPTYRNSLSLGLVTGLAILCKFSAMVFLPAAWLAVAACWWMKRHSNPVRDAGERLIPKVVPIALTAVLCLLVIWAGYRFETVRLSTHHRPHYTIDRFVPAPFNKAAYLVAEYLPIPISPELIQGLADFRRHAVKGHEAFFFGEWSMHGWWDFFPVVIAIKTPLPFLILVLVGFVTATWKGVQRRPELLAPGFAAVAVLLVSMTSRVNIGTRHVLLIYPLLAIIAALGAAELLGERSRLAQSAVVALLATQVISGIFVHPDYLAYFNLLAGKDPGHIIVDSDLDWGQDLLRLSQVSHEMGITSLGILYWGSADVSKFSLPPRHPVNPCHRTPGWFAMSEAVYRFEMAGLPFTGGERCADRWAWLRPLTPARVVGRSIRLYYVSP